MIKIEDMTYNSRNFTIDQEITSLDKESATIVDREGNALEIDLCFVLPFMELSNTVSVNEGRNSNLILNYDTDDCSFAIIEKSNSETSQNNMRLHGNVIRADSGQLINGYALAELQAEDSIDFGLTQTETRMLVDADTLFKHSYDNDCDADSPAGLLGNWSIDWYNDACRSAPFTNATSYVMETLKEPDDEISSD